MQIIPHDNLCNCTFPRIRKENDRKVLSVSDSSKVQSPIFIWDFYINDGKEYNAIAFTPNNSPYWTANAMWAVRDDNKLIRFDENLNDTVIPISWSLSSLSFSEGILFVVGTEGNVGVYTGDEQIYDLGHIGDRSVNALCPMSDDKVFAIQNDNRLIGWETAPKPLNGSWFLKPMRERGTSYQKGRPGGKTPIWAFEYKSLFYIVDDQNNISNTDAPYLTATKIPSTWTVKMVTKDKDDALYAVGAGGQIAKGYLGSG